MDHGLDVTSTDVDTPVGPARVHLTRPAGEPHGLIVLGHGAGGGIAAADLVAVRAAAAAEGWLVAMVEQPWRVAGRRVAPAPARLDAAWIPVLEALAMLRPPGRPLVVGGRSAGARVACRTADATGADAVLCLAFPLHPPGRPERSRIDELALPVAAGLPVLVVQGRRDAFGTAVELAAAAPSGVALTPVDGDHGMAAGADAAGDAVRVWLTSPAVARLPECAP